MPIPDSALKVLNSLLPEKPVIIEVGSHHGDAILQMLSIRPHAFVTGYEPSTEFNVPIKRVGKKAVLKPLAVVGNVNDGKNVFYESNSCDRCDTFYKDVMIYKDQKHYQSTDVKTVSIKDIVDKYVDFIRFDCYGSEYKIFESESSWLKNVPLIMISMHVKPKPFDSIDYKIRRKKIATLLERNHECIWKSGGKRKHKLQMWRLK